MPIEWWSSQPEAPAERLYNGRPAPPWPADPKVTSISCCVYCATASAPCCESCPKAAPRGIYIRAAEPKPARGFKFRNPLRRTR